MPADILHILGSPDLDGSSIAHVVLDIARHIDANRYRTHACFLGGDGPAAEELRRAGVEVLNFQWMRGARDPAGALRFWRHLPRRGWRIVHVHYGARSVQSLARLATGARIVYHVHAYYDPASPDSRELRPIPTWNADAVIAVSQAAARLVEGRHARVVYSGVEVPAVAARATSEKKILGVACRLAPEKGIVYLLRALPAILAAHPGTSLEIAGVGTEQAALQEEARRLGVQDAVRFLGWRNDLDFLRGRWSAYVSPSVNEGLPLSVLEAMAAGLPVVATNAGGTVEAVEDNVTGLICPAADPEILAARVIELLASEELRDKMGAAGRERVRAHFSVQQMADEVAAVYDELLRVR